MNEYNVIAQMTISIPVEADNDGLAFEKANSMLTLGDYDFDMVSATITEVKLVEEDADAQG